MPPLSDPPYPFNCVLSGFASTFERYQLVRNHERLRTSPMMGMTIEERGKVQARCQNGASSCTVLDVYVLFWQVKPNAPI